MLEKLKKLKINIGLKSIILIGVCIALILVDILTKIFEERDSWNFTVIPKLIVVESGSRNPGCAFSFLADAAWGQTFLIVMTFFMLAALIALYVFLPERFTFLKIALSMITAGAVGNLIDRIAYREVRDFVELNMFGNMVSCNFADFWIVLGTVVAVIDILFLNEWAVIPLTEKAKRAQAAQNAEKGKEVVVPDTQQDGEAEDILESSSAKESAEENPVQDKDNG